MNKVEVKILKYLYEHRGKHSMTDVAEIVGVPYESLRVAAWAMYDNEYIKTEEGDDVVMEGDDKETMEIANKGVRFVESNKDIFA